MIKLTVLYGHPTSPADFESHYSRVHVPLARAIPDLVSLETARTMRGADGNDAPYYRVAELRFQDLTTFGAAMASEQGKAAGADIARFATGGATLLVCETDDQF